MDTQDNGTGKSVGSRISNVRHYDTVNWRIQNKLFIHNESQCTNLFTMNHSVHIYSQWITVHTFIPNESQCTHLFTVNHSAHIYERGSPRPFPLSNFCTVFCHVWSPPHSRWLHSSSESPANLQNADHQHFTGVLRSATPCLLSAGLGVHTYTKRVKPGSEDSVNAEDFKLRRRIQTGQLGPDNRFHKCAHWLLVNNSLNPRKDA
jgi:hypothetical protein